MSGYVTKHGEEYVWDTNDPASLESWFGLFGHYEHFRKILLADCREAARAAGLKESPPVKLSDERALDKARISDRYVDYIIAGLNGRIAREQNVLASMAR